MSTMNIVDKQNEIHQPSLILMTIYLVVGLQRHCIVLDSRHSQFFGFTILNAQPLHITNAKTFISNTIDISVMLSCKLVYYDINIIMGDSGVFHIFCYVNVFIPKAMSIVDYAPITRNEIIHRHKITPN